MSDLRNRASRPRQIGLGTASIVSLDSHWGIRRFRPAIHVVSVVLVDVLSVVVSVVLVDVVPLSFVDVLEVVSVTLVDVVSVVV